MTISPVNPPGNGIQVDERDAVVIARGGNMCAGYCYPFALLGSAAFGFDGVTVSSIPGDPGYVYGSVIGGVGANSADPRCARFCIALQDIADLSTGRVRVKGFVRALVAHSTNSTVSIGQELHVALSGAYTASYLNALTLNAGNVPKKYVGLALEARTAPTSDPALMTVDFDGWDGVGSSGNSA